MYMLQKFSRLYKLDNRISNKTNPKSGKLFFIADNNYTKKTHTW